MSANQYDAPRQLSRPNVATDQQRNLPRRWNIVIIVLAVAVFGEAIFAGAMLSGVPWGHTAHSLSAKILIAVTVIAGLVAVVTLRRIPQGKTFGWTLLLFAIVVFVQSALGALTAKGSNLLWIHIPLGVALFGVAAHAAIASSKRS